MVERKRLTMKEKQVEGMEQYKSRCAKLMSLITIHFKSNTSLAEERWLELIDKVAEEIK